MKHLLTAMLCVMGAQSFAWAADNPMSWRLNTDDTAMGGAIQQGLPVVTELNSTKGGANWLLAPVPEVLLPTITQQGVSTPTNWKYEGGALDPASGQLVLRFSNAAPAMELQSIWRGLPGH